jgi:TonB family protein
MLNVPWSSPPRGLVALLAALAAASSRAAVIVPPSLVDPPPLVHPLADDEARARGPLVVEVVVGVGVDGRVTAVELVRGCGEAVVDAAAVAWARGLRFTPAHSDGQAVAVRVPLSLTYASPTPVPAADSAASTDQADHVEHGGHADHDHAATLRGARAPTSATAAPSASSPSPVVAPSTPSSPSSPSSSAVPAVDAGTTRVRHRRAVAPPSSTSDIRVELGVLADVPRANAAEMLSLAPGVLLQNHGGEGHPASLFLRGFDAGEGQDVELTVEGVPLNAVSGAHGHGFADTNVVVPMLVEELRVVQGPFDPRQGDFAVAGSADYVLGRAHPGLEVRAAYGQWDTARLDAAWSPTDRPDAFVGLHLGRTAGFGPARAAASASAGGGVTLHLEDAVDLRLFALASAARFAQPGPVRIDDVAAGRMPCAADADAQFFCTWDATQGGTLQRALGSAALVYRLGRVTLEQQVFGVVGASRMVENFTGFLTDPVDTGGSQRGDATEFVDGRTTVGGRTRAKWRFEWLGGLSDLDVGAFVRRDDASVGAWRLRASDAAPYKTVFDHDVDVTNVAAWGALRLVPLPFLTVTGGLRADAFFFALDDADRLARDREGNRLPRQGIEASGALLQPRATSAWRLFADEHLGQLTWQTSVGVGARSSDAAALSDGEAAPFTDVNAGETGLAWTARPALPGDLGPLDVEARVAAFSTGVARDLVFDEQAGRNVDVGASLRLGAWAMGRARWGERIDLQFTGAWTEAYLAGRDLPAPAEALTLVDGTTPRLPYVPRFVARGDAGWHEAFVVGGEQLGLELSTGAIAVAPRPIPLGQFAEPIFVVDGALRGRWRMIELGVIATNLFDSRYQAAAFNYVSNFRGGDRPASLVAANHFVAGAPRTVLFEIGLHLDGV